MDTVFPWHTPYNVQRIWVVPLPFPLPLTLKFKISSYLFLSLPAFFDSHALLSHYNTALSVCLISPKGGFREVLEIHIRHRLRRAGITAADVILQQTRPTPRGPSTAEDQPARAGARSAELRLDVVVEFPYIYIIFSFLLSLSVPHSFFFPILTPIY